MRLTGSAKVVSRRRRRRFRSKVFCLSHETFTIATFSLSISCNFLSTAWRSIRLQSASKSKQVMIIICFSFVCLSCADRKIGSVKLLTRAITISGFSIHHFSIAKSLHMFSTTSNRIKSVQWKIRATFIYCVSGNNSRVLSKSLRGAQMRLDYRFVDLGLG
jgi:hypothetical protein